MERRFTWLHLSDLHLRAGDQYDQSVVLSSLLTDLNQLTNQNQKIDLIFVTGDIAFSGAPQEYKVAEKFFKDLSSVTAIQMNNIFCIPGNHDVDRSRLSPLLSEHTRTLTSREIVSQTIGDAKERELFTDRHKHFTDFQKATFPWASSLQTNDLSYTQNININGIQLSIIGLNSAWTSGSDGDRGGLIVGERQVREALDKTANPDFIVTLLHHPFSWIVDFDRVDVEALLTSRSDVILSGHVHELGIVNIKSPDSEVYYFAAGATYQGRRRGLDSYNYVSLDLNDATAQVSLRQYSDRDGGFWAPDRGMYRSAPDGKLSLVLPERLSHRVQPLVLPSLNERLSALVSKTVPTSVPTEPLPNVPQPPKALMKEIREGHCIVFVGAGASMDAKLPSWQDLLRGMVEQVSDSGVVKDQVIEELKDLLNSGEHAVVAAFCRAKLGGYEFASYIRERLSDLNRVSRTHRLLSEIPFRAAITTNFDSFIEHSRSNAQVILPDMMERMGAAGAESLLSDKTYFPVIKMHGTVIDPDSIVLTRGDFRRVLFEKSKYREFLRRLFIDSTVFFYGYSFKDPNVDFVLQELMASYSGNSRPHYALLLDPGTIATQYWFEDFNIRVIPYHLWENSHVVATAFIQNLVSQFK